MRLLDLLSEAARNLRAHALLSTLTALAICLVTAGALVASAYDVERIVQREEARVSAGVNLWVAVPKDAEGQFSAWRCDALNRLDAVAAAGAVMASATPDPLVGPGFQLQYGTPRLAQVYWPDVPATADAIVGARVADTYGLGQSSMWALEIDSIQSMLPTTTAPLTTRNPAWNDIVVVPQVPTGLVRSCWVEASVGHREGVEALLLSWWSGTTVDVSPFVRTDPSALTPQEELSSRVSQHLPIVAGILALIILISNWVIRRAEFALYTLQGLRRTQILTQTSLETLALAYVPVVWAAMAAFAALIATGAHGLTLQILAMDSVRILCLTLLGPAASLLVLGRRNAIARIKGQ